MSKPLKDLAKVLRSKNSGPFQITIDVLFDDIKNYQRVKDTDIFTKSYVFSLSRTSVFLKIEE